VEVICFSFLKKVAGPQLNEQNRVEPYQADAGYLTGAAGSQSPYFCSNSHFIGQSRSKASSDADAGLKYTVRI